MLTVALPKGRLGEKVYRLLAGIGYPCDDFFNDHRKLILQSEDGRMRYFLTKPSDVGIYVERGAADIGIVGHDVLLETSPDVYELMDMGLGKCRLAVAGPIGFNDPDTAPLRVATKYPNVARRHFGMRDRDIDVIRLSGSIELAPLVNLSDVIVDIVETGATLRENHLCVLEDIAPSSARLIAGKSSYKFKHELVDAITAALRPLVAEPEKGETNR